MKDDYTSYIAREEPEPHSQAKQTQRGIDGVVRVADQLQNLGWSVHIEQGTNGCPDLVAEYWFARDWKHTVLAEVKTIKSFTLNRRKDRRLEMRAQNVKIEKNSWYLVHTNLQTQRTRFPDETFQLVLIVEFRAGRRKHYVWLPRKVVNVLIGGHLGRRGFKAIKFWDLLEYGRPLEWLGHSLYLGVDERWPSPK